MDKEEKKKKKKLEKKKKKMMSLVNSLKMESALPWIGPLSLLAAASVPLVAPPSSVCDGATHYAQGLSRTVLRNFHFLCSLFLALSALCCSIALFSASGGPGDAIFLVSSSLLAGYAYGCAWQHRPSSDAWPYLAAAAAFFEAFFASSLPADTGTLARTGMVVTLGLGTLSGLAMCALGQCSLPEDARRADLNPSDTAPFLSRVCFSWVAPMLRLGSSRPLEASDLYLPPREITTSSVAEHLKAAAKGLAPNASFLFLLLRAWLPLFARTTCFKLAFDSVQICGPLLLQSLIAWLEATAWATPSAPAPPQSKGLELVGLFLLTSALQTLLLHQYFSRSFRLGMLLRTSTVLKVVEKSLRLTTHQAGAGPGPTSQSQGGPTAVVSTIASDSKRLQDVSTYLSSIISAPFQIILYSALLWMQLGPSVLAGIAVMVASLPLNGYSASMGEKVQVKMMAARDARIAATSEALSAVRLIKANAWETPFVEGIRGLRGTELKHLWTYRVVSGIGEMTWLGLPVLVALSSFSAFALSGGALTPGRVFTSLSLFNLLRFPLAMLPSLISALIEASVSVKRIQAFLDSPEIQPGAITWVSVAEGGVRGSAAAASSVTSEGPLSAVSIEVREGGATSAEEEWLPPLPQSLCLYIRDAEFSWTAPAPPSPTTPTPPTPPPSTTPTPHPSFVLGPLTVAIPEGALVAIVGHSGSGKTAFVNAVLGEIYRARGTLRVHEGVQFFLAPQAPFILNGSLKMNILFGLQYHAAAFEAAVAGACLGPDLAALPLGAEEEIGERGINLSGGQKARVGLARVFYALAAARAAVAESGGERGERACLVLDDPLSAVDAHVSAALFKGIRALQGATTLLVTHNLQVCQRCDYLLVLEGGRLVQQGPPRECLAQEGGALQALLSSYMLSTRALTQAWEEGGAGGEDPVGGGPPGEQAADAAAAAAVAARAPSVAAGGALVAAEALGRGSVKRSVARSYFEAMGGAPPLALILLSFCSFYACSIGAVFWLAYWSDRQGSIPARTGLGVYSALSLTSILVLFVQLIVWVRAGLRAAQELHARLLAKLLHLPFSFFDTTPSGRLLNRVSSDMASIDGPLPDALHSALSTAFTVGASIFTAVVAIPAFLIVLPPLLLAYRRLQVFYVATSRELQRLDSVSRSPLFSHLTETLLGLACVRAFGGGPRAAAAACQLLDRNWQAYFSTVSANRWLAVRVESLSALLTAGAALVAVLSAPTGGTGFASSAGLAVATVLGISQSLNWLVRMLSDAETALVAVERLAEYADLPVEGDGEEAEKQHQQQQPPSAWPTAGAITLSNVCLRYRRDTPEVLKGVSVCIPAGARVGVVGRTGAGKTSLIAALLRTADVQSGSITLDAVDTASVPRTRLRGVISYVPQEAVLFTGSVRKNLDVLGQHGGAGGEKRLWEALRAVGLVGGATSGAARIDSLEGTQVGEGGGNFSAGERQLICIARAMLKRARVVVMDEATASVDAAGDELVQAALRKAFEGATTLVVAHRINTVLDSDLILCMQDGRVAEFGPPQELLRKGGLFRDLVEESSAK